MVKLMFLLCCLLLAIWEPTAQAAPHAATAEMVMGQQTQRIHRPRYKRYRGNSRSKKKHLGPVRRWAARRKAKRKASSPRGVIRVEAPVGTMPAH